MVLPVFRSIIHVKLRGKGHWLTVRRQKSSGCGSDKFTVVFSNATLPLVFRLRAVGIASWAFWFIRNQDVAAFELYRLEGKFDVLLMRMAGSTLKIRLCYNRAGKLSNLGVCFESGFGIAKEPPSRVRDV